VFRSSDHGICQVHEDTLLRWTSVVENGPLFSVAQEAYGCFWEMVDARSVSAWGVDTAWCPYLYEVCGFPKDGSCAVVDVFYIDHLDKKTASANLYRGQEYWKYGFAEWDRYKKTVGARLKSDFQEHAGHFHEIKAVRLGDVAAAKKGGNKAAEPPGPKRNVSSASPRA
jgi:hypothetical protein